MGARGRYKKKDAKNAGNPQENIKAHRNFLARALERNDTEIMALTELNKSLHKAKKSIIESCSELVLLDLGSGRLTLINDELHEEKIEQVDGSSEEESHHLSPAQKELCVDFLLRMKLRQKLLNRLARRLNRLAHAMDGEDVTPPPPPRYGDLSLNIDPAALAAKVEHWKVQEETKSRLKLSQDGKLEVILPTTTTSSSSELPEKKEDTTSSDEQKNTEEPKMEVDENTGSTPSAEDVKADQNQSQENETEKEEKTGEENEEKEEKSAADAQPAESEGKPVPHDATTTEETKAKEGTETTDAPESEQPLDDKLVQVEHGIEVLKEYDHAYEKIWDANTNSIKYSILDRDVEPDHSAIKMVGIGALGGVMSAEQREIEHQRWQTSVLVRIPDQPTFEELGMKNLVFCYEERRKRCLEEASQEEEEEALEPEKKKLKEGSDDESKSMDVDEDKDDVAAQKDEKAKDSQDDEAKKVEDGDGGEEEGKDKSKDEADAKSPSKAKKNEVLGDTLKRLKPLSLAAIPSFYDQDLKRIRLIHHDLMTTSIIESTRLRLAEATNTYNRALITSHSLYHRRQELQSKLGLFLTKSRNQIAAINNEYALQVAIAKQRWQKEKQEHDAQRIKRVMPSNWGRVAAGTLEIQNYISKASNPSADAVGSCLADIVDASIMSAEGKLPASEKFKDFVPPPAQVLPTGETLAQAHMRTEATMRSEFTDVCNKFASAEEERKRAWKKMAKASAENEIPQSRGGRRSNANLYTHMPPLNSSRQQPVPRIEMGISSSKAFFTPSRASIPTSGSKYSAARVKQRIAADGSVKPVSEPIKTSEGLYQRPAGRTRKGMQWDAFRGIWVPET